MVARTACGAEDWYVVLASSSDSELNFYIAIASELLLSLPNSAVSQLVFEANLRLHFDPVKCLPHEIITQIFHYLRPHALCNASLVSRSWRQRALDPKLWRRLFSLEGWTYSSESVRAFEQEAKRRLEHADKGKSRKIRTHEVSPERSSNKKFRGMEPPKENVRHSTFGPDADGAMDLPDMWLDLSGHGHVGRAPNGQSSDASYSKGPEPQNSNLKDDDLQMQDAPLHQGISSSEETMDLSNDKRPVNPTKPISASLLHRLLVSDPVFDRPISNWHYLYNQRRRLERNWYAGRFTNFRLPHPDHMSEAHNQCVYTLQYSGDHLVSGSRDKTVRVWDLRTKRLRLPPLTGHDGSVLCLQFDERPGQDLLISGGSDSDIIIWKFSNGDMIKRMKRAHDESVLNLRFDERYLVTCSKDKSIKIWNRRTLLPNDPEYPNRGSARNARYPDYIVDIQQLASRVDSFIHTPIEPFSLLMSFEGHNAAVNAIQILGDEIVSASGDRKIMLWNLKTGILTRSFSGHTKGIACVQYDGRRIVSGSSDNTVRIFDSSSSAEVATLDGHRNLVRTVQAEFGDFAIDSSTLEAQARASDRHIVDSQGRGPNEYFVLGAKLPAGGGGTPWSKIVSGSYDETVIIWRRDRQGRWYIAKELRQEEALRVASGQPPGPRMRAQSALTPQQLALRRRVLELRQQQLNQQQTGQALQGPPSMTNSAAGGPAGLTTTGPPFHLAGQQGVVGPRQLSQSQYTSAGVAQTRNAQTQTPSPSLNGYQSPPEGLQSQAAQAEGEEASSSNHPTPPEAEPSSSRNSQPPTAGALSNGGPVAPTPPNPHPHALAAAAAAAQQAAAAAQQAIPGAGGPNNRVFKLQFDARRIVCCSQEPVIVGWDFADGDREIEEASRFFGNSY